MKNTQLIMQRMGWKFDDLGEDFHAEDPNGGNFKYVFPKSDANVDMECVMSASKDFAYFPKDMDDPTTIVLQSPVNDNYVMFNFNAFTNAVAFIDDDGLDMMMSVFHRKHASDKFAIVYDQVINIHALGIGFNISGPFMVNREDIRAIQEQKDSCIRLMTRVEVERFIERLRAALNGK